MRVSHVATGQAGRLPGAGVDERDAFHVETIVARSHVTVCRHSTIVETDLKPMPSRSTGAVSRVTVVFNEIVR